MGVFSFLKCLLRLAIEAFVLILLITFIPGLPPDVNISQSWKVDKVILEGKLSPNNKLDGLEYLYKNRMHGPESLIDDNGFIYTSLHMGDISKLVGDHIVPIAKFGKPCKGVYQEEICGRPLGITFDKDGHLYAADAYYGIFKVNIKTGDKEKLVSLDQEIGGRKPKLPNSVAVACNGDIYWTDSDSNFSLQDGVFSLLGDGTGRLIHYNIKTGKNEVLLDNLSFANGVRLSQNEDYLLVSETNRNRIHRVYLKGPKMGTNDIFTDKLPGMPDNIQTDGSSGFIVAIVQDVHSKNPSITQVFSQFPNVRKFLVRSLGLLELAFKTIDKIYPNEWSQKGVHFVGHLEPLATLMPGKTGILHVSENGEILDCLWGNSKEVGKFSEAHIIKDHLYLASPFNKYLGRISLSKIGWQHLKQKTDYLSTTRQKCLNINRKEEIQPPLQNKVPSSSTETPTTRRTATKPITSSTTPKPSNAHSTTPKPVTSTEIPKPAATIKPVTTTSKPSSSQEYRTTSKPTTTTPKPSVASSKTPSATPKPPVATATAPATAPNLPAAAPKAPAAAPKPPAAAPKPPAAAPKPPAAAPKPPAAAPKPPAAAPKPPAAAPNPSSTTAKPTHKPSDSARTKSDTARPVESSSKQDQHNKNKIRIQEEKLENIPTTQKVTKSKEAVKSTNTQNTVKIDAKDANVKPLKIEL